METRLTLKQMILNKIDDSPRGYAEELAEISGSYSSGSNLKKVLRDEKKEFDNFNGLVKIVKHIFGEDEQKLMEEYSKNLDPCNKSARTMLEYLSCNRLLKSMKQLIDRMSECKNKESLEFAKVYSLQYEWQNNYHSLDINVHHKKVKECRPTIPDLKVFVNLMNCYCYYYKNNHKTAFEISHDLECEIIEINNLYFKGILEAKLNEVKSYINLWIKNSPVVARENAQKVIDNNIGNTFNAYAYFTIGYSYFFISYDLALKNLNECVAIYKSIGRENTCKDIFEIIDKLNMFWEKDISEFVSLESYIWDKIRRNVISRKEIDAEKEKLYEPFYYFLTGIKENDNDILLQSMIKFLKDGDAFQANLPRIELLKRGMNGIILNELININLT